MFYGLINILFLLQLKSLLDANQAEPDRNARLPLSNFDLNTIERSRKIDENIMKKKSTEEKLRQLVLRQDKIKKFIQKNCWDSMNIPVCSLISLDGKIKVDNYAFPLVTEEEKKFFEWENFVLNLAQQINKYYKFFKLFLRQINNNYHSFLLTVISRVI